MANFVHAICENQTGIYRLILLKVVIVDWRAHNKKAGAMASFLAWYNIDPAFTAGNQ